MEERDARPLSIREQLNNFTDREETINKFKSLQDMAQPGQLWLLTVEGNSGTGKTLLCLYLMDYMCHPLSWYSDILSFAESVPRYATILTVIERLVTPSIPQEQLREYQESCAIANLNFYRYQQNITINIENTATAKEQSTLSGLNQQAQVDVAQLSRDRELRLRGELTRALVGLAQWCTRPLCLFIDGYERFEPTNPQSISDPELVNWFWDELMMGLVHTASVPILLVTCGWQTPSHASIRELAEHAILEDFDQQWVCAYLQKVGILSPPPLQPSQQEIVDAFYQLTQGHPLVLSLAATYFRTFEAYERTAKHLQASRHLLNEKARTAFLQERLLMRLPEPYRTLLEYGPILRFFDQDVLRVLLASEDTAVSSQDLDDRTYEQFLRYPFISQNGNDPLSCHYRFHELVRQVQLEALHLHPHTLEELHRRVANYYHELAEEDADKVEEEMERQFASADYYGWPEIPEKTFNAFLEWAYHAFQVKELQEEAFEGWVLATEITIYMHRRQSRVLLEALRQQGSKKGQAEAVLEVARQLHKEGVEVFQRNSIAYGQYLILYARFLQREVRWDDAKHILEEAIETFEHLREPSAVALCYNNLGLIYLEKDDSQEAEKHLQHALDIFRAEQNTAGMAQALNNLGLTFQGGEVGVLMDHALGFMTEALRIYQHGNDPQGFATALGNMGLLYHRRQQFGHALNLYWQAWKRFSDANDLPNIALFLNNIGSVYRAQERFDHALKYYQEALSLYEKIGSPENLMMVFTNIGEVHFAQKRWMEAIQSYHQALPLAEEAQQISYQARLFASTGAACLETKQWDQAEHFYRRLLQLAEDQNETITQGMAWSYLGETYARRDELTQSIQCYEKAVKLFKAINDVPQTVSAYEFLGDGHRELRQWRLALQYYQQALSYIEQSSDTTPRAALLYKIGSLYREMRQWEQALLAYNEAQPAFLRLNDGTQAALTLNALGEVYCAQRQWEQALNAHERALTFFVRKSDTANRATVLRSFGELQYRQGLYEQALSFYEEALALREGQQEPEPAPILTLLHKVGTVYQVQGDWEHALYYYERALNLSQKGNDREHISTALNNIGNLYASIADFDRSLHYLKRSLETALQNKHSAIRTYTSAISYNNLGEVYRCMGQLNLALQRYQQAIALWQQEENIAMIAMLHNNISGLYDAQHDLKHAQASLEYALQLCQEVDAPTVMGTILSNLGAIYRQQGRWEEALAYYRQARQLFAKEVSPANRAIVLHNIACTYRDQGNMQQAIVFYQQALALYERLGTRFTSSIMDEVGQLVVCYSSIGEREKVNLYQDRLKYLQKKQREKG